MLGITFIQSVDKASNLETSKNIDLQIEIVVANAYMYDMSYHVSSWGAISPFIKSTSKEETRGKEKIMLVHSGSI